MSRFTQSDAPGWARWRPASTPLMTLGIEEEVMLLDPEDGSLAYQAEMVHGRLSAGLRAHSSLETHSAALELATSPHETVGAAIEELAALRARLQVELAELGLQAACSGTHPTAAWQATRISEQARYLDLYRDLRELARREPTFATHVHVAVPGPNRAIRIANRLREHLPLLLALSSNSPYWQGRDTGLASTRTPLFQAFPRAGLPRLFDDYEDYVRSVGALIDAEAIDGPTKLWWDVRLQPTLGTLEVRILDAQTDLTATAILAALVQSLVRLELSTLDERRQLQPDEVIQENRFLAARDGPDARFIAEGGITMPVGEALADVQAACERHAAALECSAELAAAGTLASSGGAAHQRRLGRDVGLTELPGALAAEFARTSNALVLGAETAAARPATPSG